MKIKIIQVLIMLPFLSCCCSVKEQKETEKEYMNIPVYDPQKAGAVIMESFDMTGMISFPSDRWGIKLHYDLAEYNDNIYIRIDRKLYVFDKQKMYKIREMTINFPKEFDYLPDLHTFSQVNGLVVIDDKAFILFIDANQPPYKIYLFSVDLKSGMAQHIEEKILGFEFSEGGLLNIMGYDKINNLIWFRIFNNKKKPSNTIIYYFQYDADTDVFTLIEKKIWYDFNINWLKEEKHKKVDNGIGLYGSSICGNESWNVYYYNNPRGYMGGGREPFVTMMDNRNMDNLTESISQIDVEYLGLVRECALQTCIYDPPYVWILAEKDNKFQMLKLLPNE